MTNPDARLRAMILEYAQASLDRSLDDPSPPESNLPFDSPDFETALSSISSQLLDLLGGRHAQSFRGLLSDAAARGRVGDATRDGAATQAATLFLVPIQGPAILLGMHLTSENEYGVVSRASMRFWPSPSGGLDILLPVIMTVKALQLASPHTIRVALDAARRERPAEPGRGLGSETIERVRVALRAEGPDGLEKRSIAKGQPLELVNRPEMRAIVGIRFLASEAEAPWAVPPEPMFLQPTPAELSWRAWADERYAHVQLEMDPPRSWSSGCATAAARHAMLLINNRWRTRYNLTVVEVLRGGGIVITDADENLAVTLNCNGSFGPVETPASMALMDPPRFRTELYRLSGAGMLETDGVNLVSK